MPLVIDRAVALPLYTSALKTSATLAASSLGLVLNNFLSIVILYPIARPETIPYQIVPPSMVVNVSMSIPDVVSVGAVAAAQSTLDGYVRVAEPPLVIIRLKLQAVPLAAGLVKVSV
jgi:hypothetical protein